MTTSANPSIRVPQTFDSKRLELLNRPSESCVHPQYASAWNAEPEEIT
jgi:hypothetical protein